MASATSNTALVIIQLGTHERFATLQWSLNQPENLCTISAQEGFFQLAWHHLFFRRLAVGVQYTITVSALSIGRDC